MSEDKKPQHLHFLSSGLKWDWRKENAVELILLVFLLTFFFALPRAGCGITDAKTAQANAGATISNQAADTAASDPKSDAPQG